MSDQGSTDAIIGFRVSKKERAAIERAAESERRTMSSFIRSIILPACEERLAKQGQTKEVA